MSVVSPGCSPHACHAPNSIRLVVRRGFSDSVQVTARWSCVLTTGLSGLRCPKIPQSNDRTLWKKSEGMARSPALGNGMYNDSYALLM